VTRAIRRSFNFAKAFKVRDFHALMASRKANEARLKDAVELRRAQMGEGSELRGSVLRAVPYAMMELVKDLDGDEVLRHLVLNTPNWYADSTQRDLGVELVRVPGRPTPDPAAGGCFRSPCPAGADA
jgi:putative DNA methylase